MTQNDIAFYNAKAEKRDARLRRKENKRHNVASEKLQAESNVANMLGAEARMLSAEASAQQAATKQSEYELEWAKEYGWEYGTSPDVYNNPQNYHYLDDDPTSNILVPNNMFNPETYLSRVRQERKTQQETENLQKQGVKTVFDIVKEGGETVRIIQQMAD